MTPSRTLATIAATSLAAAGLAVATPAVATADHDAEECQPGVSNNPPRTCETTEIPHTTLWTVGEGVCAGMIRARGWAYDGPMYEYYDVPGAQHVVSVQVSPGYDLFAPWVPRVLHCTTNLYIDWHNLDTGERGTVEGRVEADQSYATQHLIHAETGPGRVDLTLRTDQAHLPAYTHAVVP